MGLFFWLVGSFPSVVKSISARIEDKVYGRVFVGSTFRAVHKRIEKRSSLSLSYSTFISFPVYSRTRPNVKTRCFRVATRRISHVSIAQRFTVLSASFPRDFYTTGTTTPRPSFPSIRPIHPLLARFFLSRILRKSSREICARARRLRLPAYWFEMFQDLADIFFFV